jgi:arylsulfatase A-like enzyme
MLPGSLLSRLAFVLSLAAISAACGPAVSAKPNIIVVVSDDQGWADLGCHGMRSDVRTPNLDALAADGVRFERGHASAPVCVPSRAGLLTGRYPTRFGIETNADGPLPASEQTIGDRMRAAGYVTGLVGKWHVATSPANTAQKKSIPPDEILWGDNATVADPHLPGRRGFDEYFCGANRNYAASFDLAGRTLPGAPVLLNDSRFRVDVQTEAALAFIGRHAGTRPLFLYVGYFAPHVPLAPAADYPARFAHVADPKRRAGLALIAAIDDGVGRIRQALRERGLGQDTLIVFTSDNGAPLRPGMENGSLNTPLVGEKGQLTEGGTRVPFVAAWPAGLPAGRVYPHPVISLDILPTALAAAGVDARPEWKLDGVNLLPFLTGEQSEAPHRELFWRFGPQAAVMSGRWKLLHHPPDHWQLFDLGSPEGETRDLTAQHPGEVSRLKARLHAWAAEQSPAGLPAAPIRNPSNR